jgi:hypothetical protein
MADTKRMKKYPSIVKPESQVVGMSNNDDAVTVESEVWWMKRAALTVTPIADPMCAKLSTADQPDSKATLEPAKLGATNSKRPLGGA